MAERVPILSMFVTSLLPEPDHLIFIYSASMPSTRSQDMKANLHHTAGDGMYDTYHKMFDRITVEKLVLDRSNVKDAAKHIDHLLRTGIALSRPVYLGLPSDLISEPVDAVGLPSLLTRDAVIQQEMDGPVRQSIVDHVLATVQREWEKAERPCVLVGVGTGRFHAQSLALELIESTGMGS